MCVWAVIIITALFRLNDLSPIPPISATPPPIVTHYEEATRPNTVAVAKGIIGSFARRPS